MTGTIMTTVALPDGAWTAVLAATPTSATIQNVGTCDLWVRIGSDALVGDALSSPHDILHPTEWRALTLNAADKIFAAPVPNPSNPVRGYINVRA